MSSRTELLETSSKQSLFPQWSRSMRQTSSEWSLFGALIIGEF
ncbi:MAG: hypothetical protein ACE3L7_03700 [Candidatus Pristimantibacillus sp.]